MKRGPGDAEAGLPSGRGAGGGWASMRRAGNGTTSPADHRAAEALDAEAAGAPRTGGRRCFRAWTGWAIG